MPDHPQAKRWAARRIHAADLLVVGLKVEDWHEDIRRLTWHHPLFRGLVERGHDPDDVLQEVFAGILVRQRGPGAFDPRRAVGERGGVPAYLLVVIRSVLRNYGRDHRRSVEGRETRRRPSGGDRDGSKYTQEFTEEGMNSVDSDRCEEASVPHHHGTTVDDGVRQIVGDLRLDSVDATILRHLAHGKSRSEVRHVMGLPAPRWDRRGTDRVVNLLARLAAYSGLEVGDERDERGRWIRHHQENER